MVTSHQEKYYRMCCDLLLAHFTVFDANDIFSTKLSKYSSSDCLSKYSLQVSNIKLRTFS